MNDWLHRSAVHAVGAGTASVWVSTDEQQVAGYFALAMASVESRGGPSRLARGMPPRIPVVLLARLALDRRWQGHGNGGRLLVQALRLSVRGAEIVGARAVVVDAIDDQAVTFYEHFGFRQLASRQLYRKLSDIRGALE